MLNLFVGNKESLVRKSVLRWGTTDVVKWVRSLGSWAQGYDEKFLTAGIDGNLLLSLSEYDLEHSPLNVKPSYHRRAFLKEIENLRTLGVKSPTDVWEYKVGCHVRCNNNINVLSASSQACPGAYPGFFKGGVTARTPSGDRRLYMVYTTALPRVSASSVVLSRHEGPY